MKKTFLYMGIAATMLSSCYDDEGNYAYDESIVDISVKLNQTYGLKKTDDVMTYTITPDISTADGDKSYLKYAWTMNTSNANTKGDTIATQEALTLTMDPNDAGFKYMYFLRLYVENTRTNTVTMVPTQLQIIKPYSDSWVVLHEQDGHAELGSVEYLGDDALLTLDAFSKESGAKFSGQPVALGVRQEPIQSYLTSYWGYSAQSQLYVTTTNVQESGLYNQVEHFKLMANWQELTDPSQQPLLDFNDIALTPTNGGMVMCSNGQVAGAGYYSTFFFLMQPADNLYNDFYISKAVGGPHTAVGFDRLGHRFLHLAKQSSDYWYGYIPGTGYKGGVIEPIPYNEGNKADPSSVDPGEEVIAMIPGYKYSNQYPAKWQKYSAYAYALAPGNKSHVWVFRFYELTHAGEVSVPQSYEFPTPSGITAATPMASSYIYNNIIFYAVGNKVYKLDIASGSSSLIWQSEDTEAKITCLKMAVDGYNSWGVDDNPNYGEEQYGHPYCRCLGVGMESSDGGGLFAVIQLSTAGKVDADGKHPAVQVYRGFGKVKDIAFI